MKIITVGTGSSGNCYLLQKNNDRIIALDAGCPWKKVMIAAKFKPTSIDFSLITHDHSDHKGYVRDFKRNNVDVYDTENLNPKKLYSIKDTKVIPFEVPHDTKCYGYLLNVDGRYVVYMTDFGYCKYTFKSFGVSTWIIACNHTDLPDRDSAKYGHVVRGHSSLDTVKDILKANMCPQMKNVVLCHYNESEDTDFMASEIRQVVGDAVNVYVARKGEVIDL